MEALLELPTRNAHFAPRPSETRFPSFDSALARHGLHPLRATGIEIFQINVGKLCNQTCRHCHVDAGPDRTERMTRETAEACMAALERTNATTVDITGGAPELNENFRYLVDASRARGRHVMDRSNLTVLLLRSQSDLAQFLADREVEVIASLPYFLAERTDAQRGAGVFDKSIRALQLLNRLGYGQGGSLRLHLVYNPTGAFSPGRPKRPRTGVQARTRSALPDPIRSAIRDHQPADQPFPGFPARDRQLRAIHGAAGQRLQPGSRKGSDVPRHSFGRLGRAAL